MPAQPFATKSKSYTFNLNGVTFVVGPFLRRGQVTFLLSADSVPGNSSSKIAVIRVNGVNGNATVNYEFIDETAVNGVDYFGTNDSLTFTTNVGVPYAFAEFLKYIPFRVAQITETKTFKVKLTATLFSIPFITDEITITINPVAGAAGAVGFIQPTQAAPAGTVINVPVFRFGGSVGAVSVDYHTEDGTGIAGVDYTAASGTLNWADTDTTPQDIPVTLLSPATDKTFKIVLDTPTGGVIVAPPPADECEVTIFGTGTAGNPGEIGFKFTHFQTPESTVLTVTVQRLNGKTGAVSVTYATANGTAAAGTNYTGIGATVINWADQDEAEKTFNITILTAAFPLNFFVNLTLPTGGATLRTGFTQAEVYINGGIADPTLPIYDLFVEQFVGLSSGDDLAEPFQSYANGGSFVRMWEALENGVLGWDGGSSNFGGAPEYASDDDSLLPSPPNRFTVREIKVTGYEIP